MCKPSWTSVLELDKYHTIILNLLGYLTWGLLIALQPPFYPYEAEQKGATPQQVLKLRCFDAIKII